MRLLLAELAPALGDPSKNLEAIERTLRLARADLAVFPELFLSGSRVGDRVHTLALTPGDATYEALGAVARRTGSAIVVGAPVASPTRPGEVENAAILADPSGTVARQVKRYLPNFGPFEEGIAFTPTDASRALPALGHRVGLEICYDVFFPEVSRELALDGAEILVAISASPVTSRRLFEKLLPARAVENGIPLVYVNRVGVEDGFVFGGGSGVWDPRGEPVKLETLKADLPVAEERVYAAEVDLSAVRRYRPFRPVLRDVASRPPVVRGPSG